MDVPIPMFTHVSTTKNGSIRDSQTCRSRGRRVYATVNTAGRTSNAGIFCLNRVFLGSVQPNKTPLTGQFRSTNGDFSIFSKKNYSIRFWYKFITVIADGNYSIWMQLLFDYCIESMNTRLFYLGTKWKWRCIINLVLSNHFGLGLMFRFPKRHVGNFMEHQEGYNLNAVIVRYLLINL